MTNEPTEDQITALRGEALAHGDSEMADICSKALSGDSEARECCAEVIADALAQDDTPRMEG